MPRVRAPEWCRLLRQPSRYKVIYGGRGSGKSRNVATELLLRAASEPLRILCCREIQKSINDSVKKLLDDRRRELEYLDITSTGFFHSTKNSIITSFGSEFLFAGLRSNAESIKSLEGVDICWVEEAQTISRESLDILIPTIRKEGSEIWFTMNPRYEDDPIYADFIKEEEPRPGTVRRRVNYDENPWFPSVLYDEMMYDLNKDRDKYSHIWEGELLRHDNAKIFKHGSDWEIGEVPDPPDGVQLRYGADWGEGKSDPTTLTRSWTDLDKRIIYVDREWWALEAEYHNVVAGFKQTGGSDFTKARSDTIRCDSSRPGIMKFLRRGGLLAIGAKKGPGSVQDGINYLKSFKIIVDPKCKHTIDEFDHYKYKINKRTEEILNDPEDKDNHCIDSLRYAHEPEMLASKSRITMPS